MRSSNERRQVVSALLSVKSPDECGGDATSFAQFINASSHDELLSAAYDPVPKGFRQVLAKSGSQPQGRQYYHSLHRLLSSPHGRIAEVIGQLDEMDHLRLRILEMLPDDFLSVGLAKDVESVAVATDVSSLAALLTSRGADRDGLARAIRAVTSSSQFAQLWERWAFKAQFPDHPIPASPCYTPVRSGDDLRKISLRYRNCARRYLSEALEGSSAFGEFIDGGTGVVIHLQRHSGVWNVEGLFAKGNSPVRASLRMTAMDYLASKDIHPRPELRESRGEWDSLRRLTRTFHYDLGIG